MPSNRSVTWGSVDWRAWGQATNQPQATTAPQGSAGSSQVQASSIQSTMGGSAALSMQMLQATINQMAARGLQDTDAFQYGSVSSREDSSEGEQVVRAIRNIDSRMVPELILEPRYFEALHKRLNLTTPYNQVITFYGAYGPMTIRNKAYVLNLDMFLEDVPKCKI